MSRLCTQADKAGYWCSFLGLGRDCSNNVQSRPGTAQAVRVRQDLKRLHIKESHHDLWPVRRKWRVAACLQEWGKACKSSGVWCQRRRPGCHGRQKLLVACASSASDGASPGRSFAVDVRELTLTLQSSQGPRQVLRGCNLTVPSGQLWMLLGPNGCGKSTLLKALAGLLKPDGGRMRVLGHRSFVFQNPDHQVVMPTAAADVAFGLGQLPLSEEEVRARVGAALEKVGMGAYAQRSVQTLSGGQKQRVAIAGALAEDSQLLLLDELTTFLDEEDQMGVVEAVRAVVGGPKQVTALWVTHRLEELKYADGAAYMENGRVVLAGSPVQIEGHIKQLQEAAERAMA